MWSFGYAFQCQSRDWILVFSLLPLLFSFWLCSMDESKSRFFLLNENGKIVSGELDRCMTYIYAGGPPNRAGSFTGMNAFCWLPKCKNFIRL